MIAQHPGRCGICDEPIYPGDEITEVEDEWVHRECAEANGFDPHYSEG